MPKRLLFPKVGQVQWESFELPAQPAPHTVIAEALCSLISVGTELALFSGSHIGFSLPDPPFPMMPQRPGYAFVGRTIALGSAVEGLKLGQRVLIEAAHGSHAIADVRQTSVLALPDDVSDAEGALIRMGYIALTAARVAPLQVGESAAMYGLGLVGQLAAQLYKVNGAHPAIGIDLLSQRLSIAQANGIKVVDGGKADAQAVLANLTNDQGPDVVVEATGSPAVVRLALDLVAKGGRVVLLGSTRGRIEIDAYSHIHRKAVTVLGAHESAQGMGTTSTFRWPKQRNLQLLAEFFAQGKLRSQGLISHTIQPAELPAMYEILAKQPQDYLGVLVDWENG